MVPASFPRPVVLLGCLLLVVPLVAGCLGGEDPNPKFVATAEGEGAAFTDWDYAAAGRQSMNGTLTIDVDEAENTGAVVTRGTVGGKNFTVRLNEFVGGPEFQSGGIAANFDEHGDSGVGNALLPRMHLLLATWGPGQLTLDGNVTADPYTGDEEWAAHLMVTDTGVRDDETGKVLKSDGSSAYDPAAPGDAQIGNDREAHLVLQSSFPNASLEPITLTEEGEIPQMGSGAVNFDVPVATGNITVVIDLGSDPAEVGLYTFRLRNGTADVDAKSVNTALPTAPRTLTLEGEIATAGKWSIVATSNAAAATYTAEITMNFPPKPMWYFFWEDVVIQQRVIS